jgi:hypothetical protein
LKLKEPEMPISKRLFNESLRENIVDGSKKYPSMIRKHTDLHLFHHGIPKVLINPRRKWITSV